MKERGSVLIAVLWILGMLTVFTVAVNRRASAELVFGQWVKDRVLSRLLAESGIERALLELQSDPFKTFDAWNESWGSNPDAFQEIGLGAGSFSVICEMGQRDSSKKEASSHRYGVCDEASRLNINTASEETLRNLLLAIFPNLDAKKATAIVQAILDWRDPDDQGLTFGAEARYYHELKDPYEPRNGPFQSTDELLMVRGIETEFFNQIKAFVTVYSQGKVNFNTAPTPVLQALGLSLALAEKVAAFRLGADGKEGTKDDEVFQHIDGITPALSVAGSFSSEDFQQIANAIAKGYVTVNSSVYRIQSIGRLIKQDKALDTLILCVVNRDGTVLYWHEGED